MRHDKYLTLDKDDIVKVHGRDVKMSWLAHVVLQWFGPFETHVETGMKCHNAGCKGRLLHSYEVVQIKGKGYKIVFTQTRNGKRVVTKVRDTCSLKSCPSWGEWSLVSIEDDPKLKKAYKKQTASWRYQK